MEISKEIMISVIIPVYNAESYIDECLKKRSEATGGFF